MQNEFEKQVQQKMEELKLTPSAPVWEEVKKQISNRRGKRRFMFFLLPATLLVGAGIWWIVSEKSLVFKNDSDASNQTHVRNKKQNEQFQVKKNLDATQKPNRELTQPNLNRSAVEPSISNVAKNNTLNRQDEASNYNINKQGNSPKTTPAESKLLISRNSEKRTGKPKPLTTANEEVSKNGIISSETKINTNLPPITTEEKQYITGNLPPVEIGKNENKIVASLAKKDAVKKDSLKKSTQVPDSTMKIKVAKVDRKWEHIFTFHLGASSYQDGVFSGQKSLLAIPNGSFGGGTASNPTYDSAGKNNGISFAIGSEWKKKLGEKFELGAGLQYHYYSVRGWVGHKRNQRTTIAYSNNNLSVSEFYTNGNWNNYTTNYGIIELPVSVGYQPLKKIPLQLLSGGSYGHLLHSNALTFDDAMAIYYKNKDNRVKNFFNLFAGLQYKVLGKEKIKITAGPLVQYSFSRTQKQNHYTKPYLFFAGIKTGINF